MEDEDISRVGYTSLEFLPETDRIGGLGDAGCVDLGGGEIRWAEVVSLLYGRETDLESNKREHSGEFFFTFFYCLCISLVP